jgi:hypothetical protein
MKKIAVILFVVSAALAGCHKSKPAAKPGGDMGSGSAAAPAGDTGGSAAGSGAGGM